MKRSSNPPDPSRPAPVAPAYPSLLDLALWSGRRAVVAGGAVVALAGGITGCDATAARDIAQLAGSDYGQSPDVPMDAPWTYPEIGGADVGGGGRRLGGEARVGGAAVRGGHRCRGSTRVGPGPRGVGPGRV